MLVPGRFSQKLQVKCIFLRYSLLFWAVWAVLGCSGLFWVVLGCSGLFWAVLGCSGLFWAVWAVLGYSGLFWAIPRYSGLFWDILSYSRHSGLFWVHSLNIGFVNLRFLQAGLADLVGICDRKCAFCAFCCVLGPQLEHRFVNLRFLFTDRACRSCRYLF